MFSQGRRNGDAAKRPLLRPVVFSAAICCILAGITGCRSNQKSALVEAELRTREREIRQMRSENERLQAFNSAIVGEVHDRQSPCGVPTFTTGPAVVDAPVAVMAGTLKQITLGRGTSGLDDHGLPGDEGIQVVVVPQDTVGSAVKVPGTLVVQAFEITPQGMKVPLSRWDVTPAELQQSWRSGLFSTGYFVSLHWKTWPSTEKLRIVAQLVTLPDSRPFEAEKDIRIKLMPGHGPSPNIVVPTHGGLQGPLVPSAPIVPAEPMPKPAKGIPDDGPLLTPGAWLRENNSATREAAKVTTPDSGGARLLDPQLGGEVPIQGGDR